MSAVLAGHFSPDLKALEDPKASPPSDGMITSSPDSPTTLREPAAKRPSSRGPPNDGRCGWEWVVSVLLSEVERMLDGNMAFMSIFAHESLSLVLKGPNPVFCAIRASVALVWVRVARLVRRGAPRTRTARFTASKVSIYAHLGAKRA